MTNGAEAPETAKADELRSAELPRSFRGYDPAAVDKKLRELASGLEALARERDELRGRVEALEIELAEHRDSQQLVRDTLVSAQRAADDLKTRTEQECDAMLEAARAQASEIDAGAGRERDRLEADLVRLRQQEQELRASYRVLLHAALDRLGEESAEKATGVEQSLLDALAPGRVIGEPRRPTPTTAVDESTP